MPDPAVAATILAFDYGLKRIGVAVGQSVTGSASPLGVISNSEKGPDVEHIKALIEEWHPDRLVVGLPLHADGAEGAMTSAADSFRQAIEEFGVPVDVQDERYSSQEAEAALKRARQAGTRGRIAKQDIDAAAAVMIAERYLARI
jgi:putative Holliday junction resolvase